MAVHLAEATWTDVDRLAGETDLAVLPVGSTEQHGPHAPLGTDSLTAGAVADRGAERFEATPDGVPVVVAPPVHVGVAEEHRRFPGTLSVSPDTFRAYVRETVAGLAGHGFDRVVLVNGHGGNVAALREAGARLTRDGVAYAVPFTWFDAVEDEVPMGHGGARETAVLRASHPELVAEDRVEAAREGGADRWGEWVAGTNLAYDTDEFSENGVVGDPTASDRADGERLLSAAADALADLLGAVADRPWDGERAAGRDDRRDGGDGGD